MDLVMISDPLWLTCTFNEKGIGTTYIQTGHQNNSLHCAFRGGVCLYTIIVYRCYVCVYLRHFGSSLNSVLVNAYVGFWFDGLSQNWLREWAWSAEDPRCGNGLGLPKTPAPLPSVTKLHVWNQWCVPGGDPAPPVVLQSLCNRAHWLLHVYSVWSTPLRASVLDVRS